MKTWMKIFVFTFLAFVVVVVGSYYVPDGSADVEEIAATGNSMSPSWKDGDLLAIDKRKTPEVGDVIAFYCNAEKCKNGHSSIDRSAKRIKSTHDGCYWLEGDNTKENSFDSRWYGELCGPEIIIDGVVHKL